MDVTGLQEFLVEWFTDRAGRGSLLRLEDAPAPEFEMVTPAGERLDREAPTDGIAEARGRHAGEPFDVDVREVETVALPADHAVVRYEGWQLRGGTKPAASHCRL